MKRVLLLAGGMLALVGAGACALNMALQGVFQDPIDRELHWEAARAAADRAAAQDAATAPYVTLAATLFWVAVAVIIAGGVVLLGLAASSKILMWIDEYRLTRAQARLVWAEEGMYPVPAAALLNGRAADLPRAALAGYWQAQIAEAENVGTPEHYAPAIHYEYQNKSEGGASAPPVAGLLALPPVPTFAELLARGTVGAGQPLLLGYTPDGQALTGALKDWRSGAIAGLPGAGKTTTQRFIAAQAALAGAKLVILDPHAHKGADSLAGTLAPLAPAFLCEPAERPRDMLQVLYLVKDILERRLAGEPVEFPLFVFVDEWTALQGRADLAAPLAELLEMIAQEGRASEVQGCLSGQIWTASRSGGTALRDSLASVYCHRMKANQARLLVPSDDATRAETLATGAAVLWRADGSIADVVIPFTAGADMEAVGRLLTPGAGGYKVANSRLQDRPAGTVVDAAPWWDMAPGPVATGTPPPMATGTATDVGGLSPLQARALALWRARKAPAEIVELLGYTYVPASGPNKGKTLPVTSAAGGVYQSRLNEVLDMLHDAEGHPGAPIAGK